MARRKRIRLDPDSYRAHRAFSVTITTLHRKAVFLDTPFGLECVDLLRDLSERLGCPVFAYCLMPDHVHLLVGSNPTTSLLSFIGAWKSSCYSARSSRGFPESVWQRSFYDRAIRREEDLYATALYVLGNPVRAGLVEDFHDYPLCGSMEFDL